MPVPGQYRNYSFQLLFLCSLSWKWPRTMCLFATWRKSACQEQRKLSCNLSYLVFQFINSGSSLFLVFFLIPMLISSIQILSLPSPEPNNTYMNKHHMLFHFNEINQYSYSVWVPVTVMEVVSFRCYRIKNQCSLYNRKEFFIDLL